MGTNPSEERPLSTSSGASSSAAQLAVAVRRARSEAGKSMGLMLADPIAIVGIGCRLPGGELTPITTLEEYGQFLADGRSGIREIPGGRWEEARASLEPHQLLGGYLDGIDLFDAEFFGIAPREAHSIDPQQRLLLEVCWEALSDAGIRPSSLDGSDTGVFTAIYSSDYARLQLHEDAAFDSHTGVGAAHSVAAGRLSFLLNLHGQSLAVDTACSSSLVATHLACQSLRRQECGVAIVAATSLKLLPDEVRAFAHWGMLASDGRAKTFDAEADGFVPGEGSAVLVLKRLSDAVAQGDAVHAVIRGSAVNHDGRSSVLTAPNGPAQEAVMRAALSDAKITAQEVMFVETHGTGTSLGDPIEVEALDAVYGPGEGRCLLGAVKTNFGHLEATAGLAGLIKCVVAFQQEQIPRNLNFTRLNSQIQLSEQSRLQLAHTSHDWKRGARPRFAAVSSFGLSGTNAHVVLEEAPVLPQLSAQAALCGTEESSVCLPVSAHTAPAVRRLTQHYIDRLRRPGIDLKRLAHAAACSRDHGDFRIAVSGSSPESIAEKLEERIAVMDLDHLQERIEAGAGGSKVAYVFSGQGSLWPGALESVLKAYPETVKTFGILDNIAQQEAGFSLLAAQGNAKDLEDTAKAQPVLFALQIALAEVLGRRGIRADAVTGHSAGEIAAAVVAGVLSLEEGFRLIIRRGRLMGASLPGKMLAVEMSEEEAKGLLSEFNLDRSGPLDLAAVNAPRSVVFAGPVASIEELEAQLSTRKIPARQLETAYAFHSRQMEVSSQRLREELERDPAFTTNRLARHPAIALVSTVSGMPWSETDGEARYWSLGIRQQVQFRDAAQRLLSSGCRTVIEIGPHPALLRSVEAVAASAGVSQDVATSATLRREQSAQSAIMGTVAFAYERGASVDWKMVFPGPTERVTLPPYPWDRKRYWLSDRVRKAAKPDDGVREPDVALTASIKEAKPAWLLGTEMISPFVAGKLWETVLSTKTMPWLGEHCWQGRPIFPFAAWLEIARQAAVEASQGDASLVVLREFAVSQRLELSEAPTLLQTHANASRELRFSAKSAHDWEPFASGFWEQQDPISRSAALDLEDLRKRITGTVAMAQHYASLEESGLSYGASFRLIRSIAIGDGFALATMSNSGFADGVATGIHPCMLDACLQTLQAISSEGEGWERGVPFLPVSVRSYRMQRPVRVAYVFAQIRTATAVSSTDVREMDAIADLALYSEDHQLVASIDGLRIRRVHVKRAATSPLAPAWNGTWVELAAEELTSIESSLRNRTISGSFEEVVGQLLEIVAEERADPGSMDRVALLTRGAFAVVEGETVEPEQRMLVGLLRSFRAEYPAVPVCIVDQPLQHADSEELSETVMRYLQGSGRKPGEIALRHGKLWSLRLEASEIANAVPPSLELKIATRGLLETLQEVACKERSPAADEIQIECRAHGLNFRDVLTAMGTYAGVAAPLGAECSGVVAIAGAASGFSFKPGDRVLAFAPASMRSRVNVKAAYAVRMPIGMGFSEAATIPVAFLTAHYGFSQLAGLRRGQTVLIHSAMGGLGMASVQLAHRAGAIVFATAGTETKRAMLRGQGIQHVFDSRTSDFADVVLHATGGQGVDVILNALSGERIAHSFRCLKIGGTFLEVGKRDVWSKERVSTERPDVRYWAFDLGEVADARPDLIAAMLQEIVDLCSEGELAPLPSECFAIEEAEGAFRKMAGGRHTGKLVLARAQAPLSLDVWSNALREGTVLITGGTGALGVATARWLLQQGARRLVLVSRRGYSEASEVLKKQFGDRVQIEKADVTRHAEISELLRVIRTEGRGPLRVVIHAAGEVSDRLLSDQNLDLMKQDVQTKVRGAQVLADLTAEESIVATIYFSSAAGLLGSAGQSGYAAANAALDAMAERRNACGLRTLSVQWGAWASSESGESMFARLSATASARALRQGVRPMEEGPALAALQAAILSGRSNTVIADVDWPSYLGQFPAASAARGFFEEFLPLKRHATAPEYGDSSVSPPAAVGAEFVVAEILQAARADRLPRMEALVRASARKVLGLSASRPMPADTPLQELGLDSLMALELRNMLAQSFERPLSATLLFDHPTVRGLAAYLLELVSPASNSAKIDTTGNDSGNDARDARQAEVDLLSMSEEEAEELLLAELEREGQR